MTRDEQTPQTREDREHPIVHIDPDFSMPADGERTNSYLRAFRILFPRAS